MRAFLSSIYLSTYLLCHRELQLQHYTSAKGERDASTEGIVSPWRRFVCLAWKARRCSGRARRLRAAEQANVLKGWIVDGAADDGGVFASPVPIQALHALSTFAEQCGAAFASVGEGARVATASEWAAQERSIAELAIILQGVNFLDMPSARLCSIYLSI